MEEEEERGNNLKSIRKKWFDDKVKLTLCATTILRNDVNVLN